MDGVREREAHSLSKDLQRLEPNFKGFFTLVWTDHENNTYVNVLKHSKSINKKITTLMLEIQDLPHVKVWRKGEEMVLGDVPSRWNSHKWKAKELLKDLATKKLHMI